MSDESPPVEAAEPARRRRFFGRRAKQRAGDGSGPEAEPLAAEPPPPLAEPEAPAQVPTWPAPPPPGRAGRRMQARQERRRRRRRLLAVGAAVLLLAAGAVAVVWQHGGQSPRTTALVAPRRTQQTLLVQFQAPNGEAIGSTLLAHDRASSAGVGLLIPPQVILNVPGAGSPSVARALRTVPPLSDRNAISDLLGVTVDGGWVLDLPTLATLVNHLGGIHAEVDVPVIGGPAGQVVLVSPGPQQLDGQHAVWFATWLEKGEQEQARLARVQQVMSGILAALPPSTREVESLLSGLGERSVPSVSVAWLAAFLTGAQADLGSHDMEFDALPVVPIDFGSGPSSFRIDAASTRALVDRLLAQSIPRGARSVGNRVLVLNGVGTPGLGLKVRGRLVPAGFVYVGSRNAPHFGYTHTLVLVHGATTQDQALGARICAALGVPVNVDTADLGTLADVVVIVGADFTG